MQKVYRENVHLKAKVDEYKQEFKKRTSEFLNIKQEFDNRIIEFSNIKQQITKNLEEEFIIKMQLKEHEINKIKEEYKILKKEFEALQSDVK